ncbi:MAG: alpha/beta hydrolase [Desulfomonilaceae bacterium]
MNKIFCSAMAITPNFLTALVIACLIGGCGGCSDKNSSKDHSQKPTVVTGGVGVDSRKSPAGSLGLTGSTTNRLDATAKPIEQGAGSGVLVRKVEPITSVSAPSEYLFLDSKNIADAVVAVTLPLDYDTNRNKYYPLVIAFGGAGECARAPREGALAWVGYYKMDDAIRALGRGRLESNDFRGLITPVRLAAFNKRLKNKPYAGVIVACPYSPLITSLMEFENTGYERFIIRELVPLLKKRYRVATGRIGVDGVSMGGARAMLFGLKYPEIFSSIGSVQGAFGPFLDTYAQLARQNRDKLKGIPIQLVTSDGDGMAPSVNKMASLLKDEGIPYTYKNLTGPHDYIFNQGPGSIALLMFHDHAQRQRHHGPTK